MGYFVPTDPKEPPQTVFEFTSKAKRLKKYSAHILTMCFVNENAKLDILQLWPFTPIDILCQTAFSRSSA